jgi:hypothetical protein
MKYNLFLSALCLRLFLALVAYSSAAAANDECGDGADTIYTTVVLSLDPQTRISYRSTSTIFELIMESTNIGWLGFGFAADGSEKMIGNKAVIGYLPSQNSPIGVAQKYSLGGIDPSNILALAQAEQTLINATFLAGPSNGEVPGGSQLKFIKNLVDGDEVIPAEGKVRFIYAVGQNPFNFLGGHKLRSSVLLSLAPCTDFSAEQEKKARDYKRSLRIHGILAAVAFGLLMPLAISASALRKYLDFEICGGRKAWFLIHMILNSLSFLLAVLVISAAILSKNAVKGYHFRKRHEKVGLALFIFISLQVIASFFRPKAPGIASNSVAKENSAFEKSESNPPQVDSFEDEKGQMTFEPKSSARMVWEMGHKLFASAIIGMVMYQMHSGLKAYQRIFNEVDTWITVYWVWLILALISFAALVYRNVVLMTTDFKRD